MKRILVVEDDVNIKSILTFALERKGFEVLSAEDGVSALDILKDTEVSLILMDVMLPGMDGFECSSKIRKLSNVPIVMLTALEEESNILKGFDSGVDDYVVKPFSMRELMARVDANMRKNTKLTHSQIGEVITLNSTTVNTETYKVSVEGRESELTPTEFSLLISFYKNPNKVLSREFLLEEVWGGLFADIHTVDVNIKRLRGKIEIEPSNPKIIKTRRGFGYIYPKGK